MSKKDRNPEQLYRKRAAEKDFCSIAAMPSHLVRILVLIEDFSFYKHHGISPKAILEALWLDLKNGRIGFGGSTITQQICKNLYFSCKVSFLRKLSEMGKAIQMERKLTKDQILELYLNCVYFDNGTYGITEAAQFYFDEVPSELTFRQCFLLISLLPVVGKYNPLAHPAEFYKYMMNNAKALHRKGLITDKEMNEVRFRGPECLDERLRKPDENTWKYAVHGPLINERYGPFPAIREEEKLAICTICGEAFHATDAVQKAIAHVIVNRIGVREWSRYQSSEEIVRYTGFNACEFRAKYYREAETYINERNGDIKFERVIRNVLPVLRNEEEDFTRGCVMFYSPCRYRYDQLKAGNYEQKVPDWDFSLLERVRFPGLRGDFAFFRYSDNYASAIPVLMYHWFFDLERGRKPDDQSNNWISAQAFDEQMKYLHDNNYYYASWDELRDWIDKKIDLPEKTICLTDDDAYITFFTIAMPIFQKYEIPFTSFIPTSLGDDKKDMLAFASDPFVTFESHSDRMHAHWDICYGKSVKELYEDINQSVSYIGNHEAFAYPFGQYTDEYIEALKLSGFKLAFTTVNARVKRGMNHYALPRVRISKDMSLDDFIKALQGA